MVRRDLPQRRVARLELAAIGAVAEFDGEFLAQAAANLDSHE